MHSNVRRSPAAHNRNNVAASIIGTSLEWYDFFVYSAAAAVIFNKLFFPTFDSSQAVTPARIWCPHRQRRSVLHIYGIHSRLRDDRSQAASRRRAERCSCRLRLPTGFHPDPRRSVRSSWETHGLYLRCRRGGGLGIRVLSLARRWVAEGNHLRHDCRVAMSCSDVRTASCFASRTLSDPGTIYWCLAWVPIGDFGWRSHHSCRFAHLAPKLLHLDSGLGLCGEHAIHHGIHVVGCTRDGMEDRTKSIARGSTGHRRVKPLSSSSSRNEL
jgi:hypothetical protein